MDAVIGATPGKIGNASAGDHRLGGRTTLVDTGTTDMDPLNQGSLPSSIRQCRGEWPSSLACTDHEGIILCC